MLDVIPMVQVLARQYGWRTGCQAGCMNGRLVIWEQNTCRGFLRFRPSTALKKPGEGGGEEELRVFPPANIRELPSLIATKLL